MPVTRRQLIERLARLVDPEIFRQSGRGVERYFRDGGGQQRYDRAIAVGRGVLLAVRSMGLKIVRADPPLTKGSWPNESREPSSPNGSTQDHGLE